MPLRQYNVKDLRDAIKKLNAHVRKGNAGNYLPFLGKKKKEQLITFINNNFQTSQTANGHKIKSSVGNITHNFVKKVVAAGRGAAVLADRGEIAVAG